MTSAPLDESLDVRLRLTRLQEWQTEWLSLDRHLEEQVNRLDGNKLMELQQASHIANVRRRMEMTLVKTPLFIPERVLLSLGVRRIREVFAAQFARLTREERLLWLNSFFFLMTTDLRQLDDKIAKVRNFRSLGQTRNFLLGGESGMGKTTYAGLCSFSIICLWLRRLAIVSPSLVFRPLSATRPRDPCSGACCWNADKPMSKVTMRKSCSMRACALLSKVWR